MQSFLDIHSENCGNYIKLVPETFVIGPFIQGMNDPIHHKEFGKCFSPLTLFKVIEILPFPCIYKFGCI